MKKFFVYLVMMCLLLSSAFAATVTRSMPGTVEPGSSVTVTFNVAEMEVGKSVSISDVVPFSISDWSVTGATKADVTYEADGNEHKWEIPATATAVTLSYTASVPSGASGAYEFDAVYFAPPAKLDNLKNTLTVATAPPPAPATPPPAAPATPEPVAEEPVEEEQAEGGANTGLIVVILVIVVGIIVYFVMKKK